MLRSFYRFITGSATRWHVSVALAFAAALALELFGLHSFAGTEARLADAYMQRHASDYQVDPDIVIVDVDDQSIAAMQEIAGLWAWPREVHAALLMGLAEFAPRAVVLDMAFSERDAKRPKSDALLSAAVKEMPYVYLAAVQLPSSPGIAPTLLADVAPAFGMRAPQRRDQLLSLQLPHVIEPSAWRLGLINGIADPDGVLRRAQLHSAPAEGRLPSMAARVAQDLGFTLPHGRDFMLRWPAQNHKKYAYSELYKLLTEQRLALNPAAVRALDALFRDKIVVIGASAAGSFDHHLTPLEPAYPGLDILALTIDNLKSGHYVRELGPHWSLLCGAVLIAALALVFIRRINPLLIGAGLLLASLLSLLAADWALGRDYWWRVATPLLFAWAWFLVAATGGFLRERRSREQAVSLFGRFLNPAVVRKIIDQGETVESLSGRNCTITVLFSDIRDFTTLAETRDPHAVVSLLNRYFALQVEVVFRHGGTLDKFIGDCIMAFWGAPVDDPAHASRAVAAALEMQDNLLEFKKELDRAGDADNDFDVGIGVHSGPAVVGFIGAQRKLDYTAIGDTVNLASRVESTTRGVARVLVTEATVQACQPDATVEFVSRGRFAVKGRAAAVELFEPVRKST